MLGEFGWGSKQSGLALVLESEALGVDADDDRVLEDAIEHRHRTMFPDRSVHNNSVNYISGPVGP